jgi:hypothetical protein
VVQASRLRYVLAGETPAPQIRLDPPENHNENACISK